MGKKNNKIIKFTIFIRKFLWPTGAWHLDDGGGPPGPPVPLHHPDVEERLPELLVLRNAPTTGEAGMRQWVSSLF